MSCVSGKTNYVHSYTIHYDITLPSNRRSFKLSLSFLFFSLLYAFGFTEFVLRVPLINSPSFFHHNYIFKVPKYVIFSVWLLLPPFLLQPFPWPQAIQGYKPNYSLNTKSANNNECPCNASGCQFPDSHREISDSVQPHSIVICGGQCSSGTGSHFGLSVSLPVVSFKLRSTIK